MRRHLPLLVRRPPVAVLALLAALAVAAAPAPARAQGGDDTHPFDVQDLVTMARLSDPQVSPDGRSVAYVLRTTDLESDKGRTDLWMVPVAGGEPRRLTTDPAADSSPRWSPDGTWLYFLSSRSGSPQVWRLPLAGGEAAQVTDLPLDVGGFVLSPDGSRLAVSLDVFTSCDDVQCTADRLAAREDSKANAQLYDSLFVRHWDTWGDGRRAQLFVVPAAPGGKPPAPARRPGSAGVSMATCRRSRSAAWRRSPGPPTARGSSSPRGWSGRRRPGRPTSTSSWRPRTARPRRSR